MKKTFLVVTFVLFTTLSSNAQKIKFGVKAGLNLSDLNGITGYSSRASYHFGGVLEIKAIQNLSIQPEFLYSTQGAKADNAAFKDINYDYLTVPVLAKFYLITDKLSLDAGPQFSFLLDNTNVAIVNSSANRFDFGVVGGLSVNVTKHVFVQGRYVIGLSDTSKNSEITNRVIQFSLGYNL
ncbi:porin family protein [Flavobacterium sp.]|uniref:porin family protein n=1 Tax=Flavobacterium sp. TaxID=239 RepID=UPI002488C2DD|nr:porin family protein [Flavobacterium sp.]MDI1315836.1 porin family protein [Flavobacterium sp.]